LCWPRGQVFRNSTTWTYRAANSASCRKRIETIHCLTRDGWQYPGFDLDLFRKLKRKKAIASSEGGPYRITRRGLRLVRSELDNR
jgi:uncharacterized protein YjhX (UPF0386 family)